MAVHRRALLALSPALLSSRARCQAGPPPSEGPAGADEDVEIKVVIDSEYREADFKIVSPLGAAATTYPTETGKEMAYSARLKKTGCITDYDCVVTWPERLTDFIRLWVVWTRDRELSLSLRPYNLSATRKSVDYLEGLVPKGNLGDAMQCYLGGRRVFQKLSEASATRHTTLAVNALGVWLGGALAAYNFDHGFGRDEALVKAVERFRARAANNSRFRSRWEREFESSPELAKQFELYRTLEFDLYEDIPKLIEANNLRAANIIVEELLRRLDGTQSEAAANLRGVSRDRLVSYQRDIRARGA